jgi:1-acyl-sn-glycerol-3-phosphate acyltransferase
VIYRTLWHLLRGAFTVVLRYRAYHAERVPDHGAIILAGNHASNLDPPVIGVAIRRRCAYMAKEELFRNPLVAALLRSLNGFPVRRGEGDRAALRRALSILQAGGALVIFPEGTRGDGVSLGEPELGVSLLAFQSGAPVVPVYIHGTAHVLPRGGGFRLGAVSVSFGEPLTFSPPVGRRPERSDYEVFARAVMAAIARLRDERQAAIHAGSPRTAGGAAP